VNRFFRYLMVVGCAIIGIFLFFIASLSDQAAVFEKNYIWLFVLNSLVAVALLGLIILMLTRLFRRYKKKEFGTRLLTRLVFLFATLSIVPGALIYAVSVQFVSHSIESGFDIRVEKAIDAGLNLGRSALENSLSELTTRTHRIAAELADVSATNRMIQISRLADQSQQLEASIFTSKGHLITSTGGQTNGFLPDLPTQTMLRQVRINNEYADFEGGSDGSDSTNSSNDKASTSTSASSGIRLRVIVQIPNGNNAITLHNEPAYLQLIQPISESIRTNTDALTSANSKYQELYSGRVILRKIYIATLTLTLLLAIFAAIVSAFLLATNLLKPILLLAEGTKAVAEGNLSPRPIIASSDELGSLTQSFRKESCGTGKCQGLSGIRSSQYVRWSDGVGSQFSLNNMQ
jgi:nitrogen fixation/metabolism regulation signal transduction histidine kinase